ncbi:DUF6795 domain-containing protein [Marinagarivorans cellulosilyticus]|uniref:DUF6795 domain-containing protein n=1 Tax=Marinagarivorans cellulosilyticus TaxID=2721545 RepID=A0AAN1WKM4_9GAMM|nr:DUF6795 domain-containing protein [Marinagarivorans cellulosilyticus]BCD99356.1 hypothetical protein MARGE09_P3558 [Marinagarivorans cellulosilyticus]
MKTILKATLLTLLFASVSGACMSIPSLNPFKKEVVLMSPLKGVLLKGGQPLANVDIEVVIVMPGGEERIYKHQTASTGEFDLPVIKDTMTLGPMTEFAVSQFVDVFINGVKDTIWSAAKREPGLFAERHPASETIGLVCDINNQKTRYSERAGVISTKCTWKSLRKI